MAGQLSSGLANRYRGVLCHLTAEMLNTLGPDNHTDESVRDQTTFDSFV